MKITRSSILPIVIVVAMAAGIVYAFLPRLVPVELATAERGDLQIVVAEDGKTRIPERYVISAPVAGQILRVELHPGDIVDAGKTVLAVLEPNDPSLLDARASADAKARIKVASAAKETADARQELSREKWELAQHESKRAVKLRAENAISQADFDNAEHAEQMALRELRAAQFAAKVAAFELEQSQTALIRSQPAGDGKDGDANRILIRSPVSGKILRVFQEDAGVVAAGTRLLEVGDPSQLELVIDVLSRDAVRIKPGAKVFLDQWGGDQPLLGRVRVVEPSAFLKISALGVEEQRVYVIVDFTESSAKRAGLGDGFRVEARIVVLEATDVLKIPAGALFRLGNDWAVFAVDHGRAVLRVVRVGHSNGMEAEIVGGLREKELVVVYPSDRVADGVRIAARQYAGLPMAGSRP